MKAGDLYICTKTFRMPKRNHQYFKGGSALLTSVWLRSSVNPSIIPQVWFLYEEEKRWLEIDTFNDRFSLISGAKE